MSWRSACAPVAGLVLLVLSTLPAAGIEPEAVADAIGAALTKGGNGQATYESATRDGDNVIIKGFTLSGSSSQQSLRFEDAIVESPTEDGAGLFHSPRVTFRDGMADGEPSGSIASAEATDVTVLDPGKVEGDGFAEAILYRSAEIKKVRIMRDSEPRELNVERIAVQFSDTAIDAPRDVSATVEGLSVSPDVFKHRRFAILARARLRLEDLGYDALVFDMDLDGTWDRAAGTLTIGDSNLVFRDNAKVSVSGMVGNLPDPRVLNDADVVAQVAKLVFHRLIARYEEMSFAGRVFDLMASEQEVSRGEYTEQLSQALPFLLAPLTHPVFREELITALRAFFQNPHSLTVTIDPESPISGSEIISTARKALGTLPERLNASVSANAQE